MLDNIVFISAVHQSESAVYIHMCPLFQISFPFRSPQSTEQISLCSLVVYFIHRSVVYFIHRRVTTLLVYILLSIS